MSRQFAFDVRSSVCGCGAGSGPVPQQKALLYDPHPRLSAIIINGTQPQPVPDGCVLLSLVYQSHGGLLRHGSNEAVRLRPCRGTLADYGHWRLVIDPQARLTRKLPGPSLAIKVPISTEGCDKLSLAARRPADKPIRNRIATSSLLRTVVAAMLLFPWA